MIASDSFPCGEMVSKLGDEPHVGLRDDAARPDRRMVRGRTYDAAEQFNT